MSVGDKYDFRNLELDVAWKTSRPVEQEDQYDWENFYVEIIKRACSHHGLPLSSAKLQSEMNEWCKTNWHRCPDESLLREKLVPVYRKLKAFSKESILGFCPHRYS